MRRTTLESALDNIFKGECRGMRRSKNTTYVRMDAKWKAAPGVQQDDGKITGCGWSLDKTNVDLHIDPRYGYPDYGKQHSIHILISGWLIS